MIDGSVETVAPVVVLGIGNSLLSDDGAGLVLLEQVRGSDSWPERVEWVDGGTQGIALLGVLSQRRAAVILDAVQLGSPPGTVHVLGMEDLRRFGAAGRPAADDISEPLTFVGYLNKCRLVQLRRETSQASFN